MYLSPFRTLSGVFWYCRGKYQRQLKFRMRQPGCLKRIFIRWNRSSQVSCHTRSNENYFTKNMFQWLHSHFGLSSCHDFCLFFSLSFSFSIKNIRRWRASNFMSLERSLGASGGIQQISSLTWWNLVQSCCPGTGQALLRTHTLAVTCQTQKAQERGI